VWAAEPAWTHWGRRKSLTTDGIHTLVIQAHRNVLNLTRGV